MAKEKFRFSSFGIWEEPIQKLIKNLADCVIDPAVLEEFIYTEAIPEYFKFHNGKFEMKEGQLVPGDATFLKTLKIGAFAHIFDLLRRLIKPSHLEQAEARFKEFEQAEGDFPGFYNVQAHVIGALFTEINNKHDIKNSIKFCIKEYKKIKESPSLLKQFESDSDQNKMRLLTAIDQHIILLEENVLYRKPQHFTHFSMWEDRVQAFLEKLRPLATPLNFNRLKKRVYSYGISLFFSAHAEILEQKRGPAPDREWPFVNATTMTYMKQKAFERIYNDIRNYINQPMHLEASMQYRDFIDNIANEHPEFESVQAAIVSLLHGYRNDDIKQRKELGLKSTDPLPNAKAPNDTIEFVLLEYDKILVRAREELRHIQDNNNVTVPSRSVILIGDEEIWIPTRAVQEQQAAQAAWQRLAKDLIAHRQTVIELMEYLKRKNQYLDKNSRRSVRVGNNPSALFWLTPRQAQELQELRDRKKEKITNMCKDVVLEMVNQSTTVTDTEMPLPLRKRPG